MERNMNRKRTSNVNVTHTHACTLSSFTMTTGKTSHEKLLQIQRSKQEKHTATSSLIISVPCTKAQMKPEWYFAFWMHSLFPPFWCCRSGCAPWLLPDVFTACLRNGLGTTDSLNREWCLTDSTNWCWRKISFSQTTPIHLAYVFFL